MKTRNFIRILLLIIITILTSSAFLNLKGYSMEAGPGEGYATIYVYPALVNLTSPPYRAGDKFTVQVRIYTYSQVASWQAKLIYDNSTLKVASTTDAAYAQDYLFPTDSYVGVPASTGEINATHEYVMMTSATYGAVEFSGTDAGLLRINFTIVSLPAKGQTLSSVLWLEPEDTYTRDENIEVNDEERTDGYYQITTTEETPQPPPEPQPEPNNAENPPLEIIIAVVIIVAATVVILGLFLIKRREKPHGKR